MSATGGQRVGAVTVGPHELLEIVIINAWPLLLRTDESTKRSLSLVCLNTCSVVGDLESDVPAQLHIGRRSCQLGAFRRIEHLVVQGSCSHNPLRTSPGLNPQLRRGLSGLAARLRDVTLLDLHRVPCLSGDCAAAATSCMPRVAHLHLERCGPPLQPDADFFSGLTDLTHLASLCGISLTTPAEVHSLAVLTFLTRLKLYSTIAELNLAPLSHLVQLQHFSFPHDSGREPPYDLTWMRSLIHLDTLQHCPPPSVASVRALASCTQLTSLSIYDLFDCGWDEVDPPTDGAAPPHSLPALRSLTFTNNADVCDLRGLFRTVSLPALRWLEGKVGLDYNHDVDESADGLEEILDLCPGVSTLQLLLSDFGEEEDAAWTAAMVEELKALRADLAAEGRAIVWDMVFDSPHWQG